MSRERSSKTRIASQANGTSADNCGPQKSRSRVGIDAFYQSTFYITAVIIKFYAIKSRYIVHIFQSNEIVAEKQICQELMKEKINVLGKFQEIEGESNFNL